MIGDAENLFAYFPGIVFCYHVLFFRLKCHFMELGSTGPQIDQRSTFFYEQINVLGQLDAMVV